MPTVKQDAAVLEIQFHDNDFRSIFMTALGMLSDTIEVQLEKDLEVEAEYKKHGLHHLEHARVEYRTFASRIHLLHEKKLLRPTIDRLLHTADSLQTVSELIYLTKNEEFFNDRKLDKITPKKTYEKYRIVFHTEEEWEQAREKWGNGENYHIDLKTGEVDYR